MGQDQTLFPEPVVSVVFQQLVPEYNLRVEMTDCVSSEACKSIRVMTMVSNVGTKAGDEVDKWRRSNRLPFPSFSSPDEAKMEDQLSYPPIGSPDYAATNEELASGGERLSAADPEEESCTNASSSSQKT